MTPTLTSTIDPAVIIEPELVVEYEASRPIRNQHAELVDDATPAATLNEAGARRGRMTLLFNSAAAAHAAYAALGGVDAWQYDEPGVPEIGMVFTLSRAGGELSIRLEPEARRAWLVSFGWQEGAP